MYLTHDPSECSGRSNLIKSVLDTAVFERLSARQWPQVQVWNFKSSHFKSKVGMYRSKSDTPSLYQAESRS